MNKPLEKRLFSLADNPLYVEGYTDGSTWNGWSKPIFTAENLKKVFHPYVPVFSVTDDCIPVATIDIESNIEIIESSPVWDDNLQDWLIGYAPEGFCFTEKDN
jgi:hypothetical protein